VWQAEGVSAASYLENQIWSQEDKVTIYHRVPVAARTQTAVARSDAGVPQPQRLDERCTMSKAVPRTVPHQVRAVRRGQPDKLARAAQSERRRRSGRQSR
jgi:hypothetical protein